MTGYKWADIASSESCASFGRTTVMLLERRERYSNMYKGVDDGLRSHYMLMSNDSYIDKTGLSELQDSRFCLKLKDVVKLTDDKSVLTIDDTISTPSLCDYHHHDGEDPKKNLKDSSSSSNSQPHVVQSFANFLELPETLKAEHTPNVTPQRNINADLNHKRNNFSHNYFDDVTKKPLNPTKRPKEIRMSKTQKDELSQLLLRQIKKTDKVKQQENTNNRFFSRLKDIAIGKATKGYQNYIRTVPIYERGPDDPQTPNIKENISASKFRAVYRAWRAQLHRYDDVK